MKYPAPRKEKFVYGSVLVINGINYYVPVTSKTKGKQDDILITDKKGCVQSSLLHPFSAIYNIALIKS